MLLKTVVIIISWTVDLIIIIDIDSAVIKYPYCPFCHPLQYIPCLIWRFTCVQLNATITWSSDTADLTKHANVEEDKVEDLILQRMLRVPASSCIVVCLPHGGASFLSRCVFARGTAVPVVGGSRGLRLCAAALLAVDLETGTCSCVTTGSCHSKQDEGHWAVRKYLLL